MLTYMPEKDFKVTMPDMLGFGRSDKPDDSDYGVDEHAKAIVSCVLSKYDLPIILVGHSMGAMVATRIAKLYPHLVSRLILINIPLFTDNKMADQTILRNMPLLYRAYMSPIGKSIYTNKGAKPTKTVPRIVSSQKPHVQDITRRCLNHTRVSLLRSLHNTILGYRPLIDLQDIEAKTTLIYSRNDSYFSQNSFDVVNRMTHIETIELTGGHQLPLRQAERIARIISADA